MSRLVNLNFPVEKQLWLKMKTNALKLNMTLRAYIVQLLREATKDRTESK